MEACKRFVLTLVVWWSLILWSPLAFAATYTVSQTGAGDDYSVAGFNALSGTGFAGDTFYFDPDITSEIEVHIEGTVGGGYVTLDGYQAGTCDWIGTGACASCCTLDRTGGSAMIDIDGDLSYIKIRDFYFKSTADNSTATETGVRLGEYGTPSTGVHIHIGTSKFYGIRHYPVVFWDSPGYTSVTKCLFDDVANGPYWIDETGSGYSEYNLMAECEFDDVNVSGQYFKISTGVPYDGNVAACQSITNSIIRDNVIGTSRDALSYWTIHDVSPGIVVYDGNTIGAAPFKGMVFSPTDSDYDMPQLLVARNTVSGRTHAIRFNRTSKENHHVLHNTAYNCTNGMNLRHGPCGIEAKNNIFHTMNTYFVYRQDEGYTPSGWDFDYNNYYVDGPFYWTSALANLAAWQAGSSLDANSVTTDPGLVDPANGDFTIGSSSNAKDAGTTLAVVTTANGSGSTFSISTDYIYMFHDGLGIEDIDGNVETGTEITLYDATNGYQNDTITNVNYGTGAITVDGTVSWLSGVTTVAYRYGGTAPDLGYYEFDEPDVDPVITVVATDSVATEEGETTGTWTVYCNPDCAGETINLIFGGDATPGDDYKRDTP